MRVPLPLALVASLSILSVLACGHGPEGDALSSARVEEGPPVAVSTARAEAGTTPVTIPMVGTLVADQQAQIAADTNGVVVETRFERGQRVRRGEVLAVVDTRISALSATASAAQAAAQRAQLEVADSDCKRSKSLFDQGVIAAAQWERVRAGCEAQAKALEAASASADVAASNLDRTKIRAPFDGVVGERMVEVGQFVGAANPIGSIYASGPLRVRVSVPESQSSGVRVGGLVTVTPTATPDQSFQGEVRYVSGAIREMTRDLIVEAVLAEEHEVLRPGMFARVDLQVADRPGVLVPTGALVREGTINRLYFVKDGFAVEKVVRVGAERDGKVAILSDVVEGDVVIVDPRPPLKDGSRVTE